MSTTANGPGTDESDASEGVQVPVDALAALNPDSDALLRLLSSRVDDGMLSEIARADYGNDSEAHGAALQRIRDSGEIPVPMDWEPKEVLELIRWSETDDPAWRPGAHGERGHIMRAWCCTILLRAAADPVEYGRFLGESETLSQLVASTGVLGPAYRAALLQLLAWRIPRCLTGDEEDAYFAVALPIIGCGLGPAHLPEVQLSELLNWVEAHARQFQSLWHRTNRPADPEKPLLNVPELSRHFTLWQRLAREVLIENAAAYTDATRARLRSIGEWLAGPAWSE